MKLGALDHPKTFNLTALLECELPTTIGHLEFFWTFVAQYAPQGNVGKWTNAAIAKACLWNQEPDKFIDAMINSGFLDESKEYRLVVHDWHEHTPNWVRAKLKRAGLKFIQKDNLKNGLKSGLKSEQGATSEATISVVKCSVVKGREKHTAFFEKFYSLYPKKVTKKETQTYVLNTLKPNEELQDVIFKALDRQKAAKATADANDEFLPDFPDPIRWLRNRRWEDEINVKPVEEVKWK